MQIPIGTILERVAQLNRELDLFYAEVCCKAPTLFTRSYILQTRGVTAKASFERLIDAGVIQLCSDKRYRFDKDSYQRFKHGHLVNQKECSTSN